MISYFCRNTSGTEDKTMGKITDIIAWVMIAAGTVSCTCSGTAVENQGESGLTDSTAVIATNAQTDSTMIDKTMPEEPVFDIITDLGTIKVKLYSKTPLHRDNFIKLARQGFYNGTLFHRVINGFMIQGGDPLTKDPDKGDLYGTGGPGYTIPAEFVNEYYHKKGALAAARRGDIANPTKASSGSQFYLVQDEYACLQLDGEYTIFGETVEGLDIIDKIASVQTDRKDRPVRDIKIIRIVPDPELNRKSAD